jgi:hypothetical protein
LTPARPTELVVGGGTHHHRLGAVQLGGQVVVARSGFAVHREPAFAPAVKRGVPLLQLCVITNVSGQVTGVVQVPEGDQHVHSHHPQGGILPDPRIQDGQGLFRSIIVEQQARQPGAYADVFGGLAQVGLTLLDGHCGVAGHDREVSGPGPGLGRMERLQRADDLLGVVVPIIEHEHAQHLVEHFNLAAAREPLEGGQRPRLARLEGAQHLIACARPLSAPKDLTPEPRHMPSCPRWMEPSVGRSLRPPAPPGHSERVAAAPTPGPSARPPAC